MHRGPLHTSHTSPSTASDRRAIFAEKQLDQWIPATSSILRYRGSNKEDCQLWKMKFCVTMPFLRRAMGPRFTASPLKGTFCPAAPSTKEISYFTEVPRMLKPQWREQHSFPDDYPDGTVGNMSLQVGQFCLTQESQPLAPLPPISSSPLTLGKGGPYTPHQPWHTTATPQWWHPTIMLPVQALQCLPSPSPQQYLALLGLLVLLALQRPSAEDWQKLSLVSLAGGWGFLAGENQWSWASCPEWVHTWLTTAGNSLIPGQSSPTAQQNPQETASFHALAILKQTGSCSWTYSPTPRCPHQAFSGQHSYLQELLPKVAWWALRECKVLLSAWRQVWPRPTLPLETVLHSNTTRRARGKAEAWTNVAPCSPSHHALEAELLLSPRSSLGDLHISQTR